MDKGNQNDRPEHGIFWALPDDDSPQGFTLLCLNSATPYTSRRGGNHTHKNAWEKRAELFRAHPLYKTHIKNRKYNYYPRGRVELGGNGKDCAATIWLNPSLNRPDIISEICKEFGLNEQFYEIKEDHSAHYMYGLPTG